MAYKKHLTPESHYNMVLRAEELLHDDNLDEQLKDIIKMFAIHGMSAPEISRSGKIISKRKTPMSPDMVWIWIKRFFPDIEFDETPTRVKRTKNIEHMRTSYRIKQSLLRKNPKCAVCGSTEDLELDHIITVYAGGDDSLSNLQLLCHKCHMKKTNEERRQFGWSHQGGRKK